MLSAYHSILSLTVVLVWCAVALGVPFFHDEPLILTPFIDRGDIDEGLKAARNPDYFGKKESYSGYFTVNRSTDTNLFFWYFKSETAPQDAPVILWLQGGPGASSLVGAFLENGPYNVLPNSKMAPRRYYWSKRFHVLYMDNPAGTGFSFSERDDYAANECTIGVTLYEALLQFFTLFPDLRQNRFYVAGESYAGKYVPSVAHCIHINNPKLNSTTRIRLSGIALGNAIIDPASQIDNGDLYYQLGIFDSEGLRKYKYVVQETLKYIKMQNWDQATSMYYKLMDLTYEASGFETLYNFLKDKKDIPFAELENVLNDYPAKAALHVGRRKFHTQNTVAYQKLTADRTQSVKEWFLEILENYDVLIYAGQLDLVKPYSGMVHFMSQLEWSGASSYQRAPRTVWKVNDDIAGYSKTLWHRSNLDHKPIKYMEMLVRNAGHLVPRDQPKWTMNMMLNFTGTGSVDFLFK